jgi:hypothetical protein
VNGLGITVSPTGAWTNTGTLQASNGGTLDLTKNLTNAGGTIQANANSIVDLNTMTITGGTLKTVGNGTLKLFGSTVNSFTAFTNSATGLVLAANGMNTIVGFLDNSAGGNVTVNPSTGLQLDSMDNGGQTLVGGSGGALSVNGAYNQSANSTLIDAGGTLASSTFNLNGGTAQVDGTLNALVSIAASAMLFGNGTITGNVNNAGKIHPGDTPAPGVLSETGNYTQMGSGFFIEDISSAANFGQFLINGNAALSGTLDVALLGGFTPVVGEQFVIMTFNQRIGTFSMENGLQINPSEFFEVVYNPNNVTLEVFSSQPPPGVPEPNTLVLLATGMGLVGLGLRLRRKKASYR